MGEGYRPAPIPRARPTVNARAVLAAPRARRTRHPRTHPRAPTPTRTVHRAPRHRHRRPRPIQRDLGAQTLHRPSQSHPTTTRAPTTRTPHHTAHRSHQKPIHRPRASRIAAPARARRQSASFPSSSIANDYSERRASSHRKKTYHQRAARRGDARGLIRAILHARAAKGQRAGRGERRGDGRESGHREAWGCDDERARAGPHTVHSMGVDRSRPGARRV